MLSVYCSCKASHETAVPTYNTENKTKKEVVKNDELLFTYD